MYNCMVLHSPNVGKFGWGTWASEKKKKTLAHDPRPTLHLVQVHGPRLRAGMSAWDTQPSACPKTGLPSS